MVITHILGGLGNQMFQYAAARSFSIQNKEELLLDLRGFENYRLHSGYQLNTVFNIDPAVASPEEISKMIGWRDKKYIKKLLKLKTFSFARGQNLVIEPQFNFWKNLFSCQPNSYLYGYWQSEKYFKLIERIIRHDFRFRDSLDLKNSNLQMNMLKNNSISLHIRRGDYVSNTKNAAIMNYCGLDYYERAIKYLVARLNNPIFYIFSDDIEWVRNNIRLQYSHEFIDNNSGKDGYKDMQLMSSCKHHVIANSTFSWWGAWLNSSPDKIVIAPKKWFINQINDVDLVPESWLRL